MSLRGSLSRSVTNLSSPWTTEAAFGRRTTQPRASSHLTRPVYSANFGAQAIFTPTCVCMCVQLNMIFLYRHATQPPRLLNQRRLLLHPWLVVINTVPWDSLESPLAKTTVIQCFPRIGYLVAGRGMSCRSPVVGPSPSHKLHTERAIESCSRPRMPTKVSWAR